MGALDGVRVLEVATYALGPAAAAVLSDWGADVVKVEHPDGGDPLRGLSYSGIDPGTAGFSSSYMYEVNNRGKRSIGIDLTSDEGKHILHRLIQDADVFITNFRGAARVKLGIEPADVQAINPKIVYARATGYGPRGPEADKGGYDNITYWCRTGMATAAMQYGIDEIVGLPGPGFGDVQGAMSLAGGIAAALFQRERTDRGAIVDASLLGAGMWAMQKSLVGVNMLGVQQLPKFTRGEINNPLVQSYRTSDDRHLFLSMLQADRYWGKLCELIGRQELVDDMRFRDSAARRENAGECVAVLESVFSTRTLAQWCELLSQQDGQWEVVKNVGELNDDEQAWANGYLQEVEYGGGRSITMVPCPVQIDETVPTLRRAPELGAHTEEVLLELGFDWEQITAAKENCAIT